MCSCYYVLVVIYFMLERYFLFLYVVVVVVVVVVFTYSYFYHSCLLSTNPYSSKTVVVFSKAHPSRTT